MIKPHQQIVVDQKKQNDERANKLSEFIGLSEQFKLLSEAEQELMKEQNETMWELSEILGKRIAAFQ